MSWVGHDWHLSKKKFITISLLYLNRYSSNQWVERRMKFLAYSLGQSNFQNKTNWIKQIFGETQI